MIWKVYAQNVIRPKGMAIIGMNSDEEFEEELEKAVIDFLDVFDYSSFKDSEGDFSDEIFDDIYNAVFELIEEHWNKYKYLGMGDYMLTEKDEMPNRPNGCGCINSLFSVEDVRNRLKKNKGMTREEAIEMLKRIKNREVSVLYQSDALDVAIKALQQEPIIDKIRAEIEQTNETVDGFLMHDETKRTVLQILDKYKAESEGE